MEHSLRPPTALQCHLPAWAPSPMVPALDGGCGGGGGVMRVVLSFAPAWRADANGLAQESRLDWLFQS